jgi:hypothetical protein
MSAQIVFTTSGYSNRVFSTISENGYVITSKIASTLFTTTSGAAYAKTSGDSVALFSTISGAAFLSTSPIATTFFVTPDPNTPRELVLKIGDLEIQGDYTYIDVPDATGDYVAVVNPGGYNVLPTPYNPYRPYRDNLSLWTVYRIWNVYGQDTQSPDAQNEAHDVPYVYPLMFPTTTNANGDTEIIRGIYEIILIGAPYFNESDSGGTYFDDTVETYYLVDGTETTFNSLSTGDYLYYVSNSNGELFEMNQVDHVFNGTNLNLQAAPTNTPFVGERLYGSATTISGMVNSDGEVFFENGYVSAPYYTVTGIATDFTSGFNYTNYFYYIDPFTGDYVELGRVLEATSATTINIYDRTENTPTLGGEILCGSGQNLNEILVNSNGTLDTILGLTITGTGTAFNTFETGQTLFFQLVDGTLFEVGVIDSIISDTELTVASVAYTPASGDRLFASSETLIVVSPSAGLYDSISAEQTFYTLKGSSTQFQTNFVVGDYIYIVSPTGVYNELGQVSLILSETEMVFYSPNSIEVNANDFIWGNASAISLINLTGTFAEYASGTYYNVEGTGTTFLSAFEPEQYLFYLDNVTGNYIQMGKIWKIYDDTNVWCYEAPTGSADINDELYSSYSLNTETAEYSQYAGLNNLYEIASQYAGWYVTSVGILIDDLLVNCITRMRYEFLQQVMCGKCPDTYLEAYAIYVGMLNAMDIQEWATAVVFYNKLKEICAATESSCGC